MKKYIYRVSVKDLPKNADVDLEAFTLDLAAQLKYQGENEWELRATFIEYGCLFFIFQKEKEPQGDSSPTSM